MVVGGPTVRTSAAGRLLITTVAVPETPPAVAVIVTVPGLLPAVKTVLAWPLVLVLAEAGFTLPRLAGVTVKSTVTPDRVVPSEFLTVAVIFDRPPTLTVPGLALTTTLAGGPGSATERVVVWVRDPTAAWMIIVPGPVALNCTEATPLVLVMAEAGFRLPVAVEEAEIVKVTVTFGTGLPAAPRTVARTKVVNPTRTGFASGITVKLAGAPPPPPPPPPVAVMSSGAQPAKMINRGHASAINILFKDLIKTSAPIECNPGSIWPPRHSLLCRS